MNFRSIFLALSFVLPLLIPADRLSENCPGAWSDISDAGDFPQGLGVNIHFTDPQSGEIEMIANAGFRWIRMDLKWDATEIERGKYDFSAYDRLSASLAQHGLKPLFILDYGNPLYDNGAPPRSDEARQAFTRWAVAAAKHFAGRGVIWETYNEPNIKLFWPPRPNVNEYIALALAVGRAFRAEVPGEKLVGPATSGIDFAFLESCFKAGLLDYWSAVSVHPYRQSNPETAASDYCRLRQLIAQYSRYPTAAGRGNGRVTPIISSEWGYSAVWRDMTEEKQSAMISREILTNIANGIAVSIWYDWHDDGMDVADPEHHFGLVRYIYQQRRNEPFERKSAYVAAKTLATFINGYKFEKRLSVGSSDDYILLFRNATDVRIAAWTTRTPHSVTVPLEAGGWLVMNHQGEGNVLSAGPAGLTLQLSNSPVYLLRN